jgi:transposase InsO family protein
MLSREAPVRQLCALVGCASSSYYYRPYLAPDGELRSQIEAIAVEFPRYGYRRITAELDRRGYRINHKRVLHLMREANLLVEVKRFCRTTDSRHSLPRYPNLAKDLIPEGPDHIWCADITYIRLQKEFLYLAVLMDVFTRAIRGWHLSRHLTEELTKVALQQALVSRHPQIHHSDQGVQYASAAYIRLLEQAQVHISMAAVGRPTENPYAERLIRTLKEEEVYLQEYENFADAHRRIGCFLDEVYMYKRVHSSLAYLTPTEFETEYYRDLSRFG